MNWRRLRPQEIDHELIWLCVSVGSGLLAFTWLCLGLPLPVCPWHECLGLPCPTCGATRCFREIIHHHWGNAFAMNPMMFFVLVGMLLFDGYAAIVLALKLPRLRFETIQPNTKPILRCGFVTTFLLNWAWLIASGR